MIIIIALIIFSSSSVLSVNTIYAKSVSGACADPNGFGFTNQPGTRKYYRVIDILLPWFDGETLCERYGAHLPIIYNKNDMEFLKQVVGQLILVRGKGLDEQQNFWSGIWLGGYLSASTKKWQWVDGNPLNYTDWGPGEPNNVSGIENCLSLTYAPNERRYLGMNDYHSSFDLLIVCELQC